MSNDLASTWLFESVAVDRLLTVVRVSCPAYLRHRFPICGAGRLVDLTRLVICLIGSSIFVVRSVCHVVRLGADLSLFVGNRLPREVRASISDGGSGMAFHAVKQGPRLSAGRVYGGVTRRVPYNLFVP